MNTPTPTAAPQTMTAPAGASSRVPAPPIPSLAISTPADFEAMLATLLPMAETGDATSQPPVETAPQSDPTEPQQTPTPAQPPPAPAVSALPVATVLPDAAVPKSAPSVAPKPAGDRKDKPPRATPDLGLDPTPPVPAPLPVPVPTVVPIGGQPSEPEAQAPSPLAAPAVPPDASTAVTNLAPIQTEAPHSAPVPPASAQPHATPLAVPPDFPPPAAPDTAQVFAPALPTPPLVEAPRTPTAAPAANAVATPAEQVVPVVVSVINSTSGASHMSLQLRPDALGSLHIQIGWAPDTPTQIRIVAERPESLALLQRDAPQLQRALAQAGLPHESMTLTLDAAPAVAAVPASQDGGQSQTATQFMGTGQSHQGFAEGRPRHAHGARTAFPAARDATPESIASIRSGIDITA